MSFYPHYRPRRMRRDDFSRRLMRENMLTANDLIYPVFILEGANVRQAVPSMPGVERVSVDLLLAVAEQCVALGIPVLALFPVIEPSLKTPDGREAVNPDGLIPRAVRELKKHFPGAGRADRRRARSVHQPRPGRRARRDRLRDQRRDRRDPGRAGAGAGRSRRRHRRAVGHDGRPHRRDPRGARRARTTSTRASWRTRRSTRRAFYGPFRDAVGSAANLGKSNKKTYQMDPANSDEALREVRWTSPKAPTW